MPNNSKQHPFRLRVLLILISVTLVALSILTYGTYLYVKVDTVLSNTYEAVGSAGEVESIQPENVALFEDTFSILIMGIDTTASIAKSKHSRTDSLLVATVNKTSKSVKLVSIPRDSYVTIPDRGNKTKINHAHSIGGTEMTIKTVETLLDIPIDYYVKLNYQGFIEIVDALDGITVDVPYEFREQNSKNKQNEIHLLSGIQKLDGEQALALARTRKLDSDIERGKRQQEIIKAIVQKSRTLGATFKYDTILNAIEENMKTNIETNKILSLITFGITNKLDIETLTLAGKDYQPGRVYFWKLDEEALEETKEDLKNHLSERKP